MFNLEAIIRSALKKFIPERGVHINDAYMQLAKEVREQDEYAWINDLYVEDNGTISAIISSNGKLYRASMSLNSGEATLSTWEEVEIVYQPRERGFTVVRQTDGTYRWFAIAETAVLLRVGEIDSTELFDNFVENVREFGYPVLRLYHDDRMDFGVSDWIAREEKCLLASGTLDDHPLAEAMVQSVARGETWGTSVGFTATEEPELWEVAEGVTIPVNKRGILREISVLPENKAASWFTSISTEVTRMRPEVSEAIVRLFGDEEKAQAYIETVDETNRQIYEKALITRADEGQPVEDAPVDTTEQTTEYVTKADFESAITEVRESLPNVDFGPLEERLQALTDNLTATFDEIKTRLDALEQPVEERIRQAVEDMPDKEREVYRPREAKEEKVTFDSVANATLSQIEH